MGLLLSGCIFWVDQWLFNEIWTGQQVASRFFLKQSGLLENSRKVASESPEHSKDCRFVVSKDKPVDLVVRCEREKPQTIRWNVEPMTVVQSNSTALGPAIAWLSSRSRFLSFRKIVPPKGAHTAERSQRLSTSMNAVPQQAHSWRLLTQPTHATSKQERQEPRRRHQQQEHPPTKMERDD